jgi:hypothetical protein
MILAFPPAKAYSQRQSQKLQELSKKIIILDSKKIPIKAGTRDSLVNLVSVHFSLNPKDTVFIKDLGFVSGQKTVSFFSDDSVATMKFSPEFTDSLFLAIKPAKETLGSSAIDFPDEKIIPSPLIDYDIKNNDLKGFDQRLRAAVQKYFSINPESDENNGSFRKITAFRTVFYQSGVTGQACLYFLYPYKTGDQFTYKLGYKTRQRKRLTDWKDAEDDVKNATLKFISDFTTELSK